MELETHTLGFWGTLHGIGILLILPRRAESLGERKALGRHRAEVKSAEVLTVTRERSSDICSTVRTYDHAQAESLSGCTQLRREHVLDGVSRACLCSAVLLDSCTLAARASGQRSD